MATLQTLEQERCTSVIGVPAMFIAQLGLPEIDKVDLNAMRMEIKLIDPETGQVVAQGEQGELCSRSAMCMVGYYDKGRISTPRRSNSSCSLTPTSSMFRCLACPT